MQSIGYRKSILVTLWMLTIPAIVLLFNKSISPTSTINILKFTILDINLGIGLRLDILSALLFVMVTILGATIGHYSLDYLAGEKRQDYFYRHLFFIVLSASALVLSSNLIMFFLMWLSVSYNLHKLLTFYDDRFAAVLAARKKAVISRFGDFALLVAIGLTYGLFETFEFSEIFAAVATKASETESSGTLSIIGSLLVIGALTKSAQFPFHFWLPDTMEAPTPVSALMHAGVINAGGFLIIRLSPLLEYAPWAQMFLSTIGAFSASFGALCMIVQNDIKRKLAFSTISQMGMMMLACGLELYGFALFHIFAHSFYKAYAFLATGKLVEESKKVSLNVPNQSTTSLSVVGTSCLALIITSAFFDRGIYLQMMTYLVILLLGFLQNLPSLSNLSVGRFETLGKIVITLLLGTSVYAGIEYLISENLRSRLVIPPAGVYDLNIAVRLTISVIIFSIFFASFLISRKLVRPDSPALERLYVYLRNGGYLGPKSSVFMSRLASKTIS